MPTTRSVQQRKADVIERLEHDHDTWLATAGDRVHLVPLTFDWVDGCVVIATPDSALTTRNLRRQPTARLAFGDTRDVVLMDAVVDRISPIDDEPALRAHFEQRHGTDPRSWGDEYAFLVLRAVRILAWRHEGEIPDRTLMRDGEWAV